MTPPETATLTRVVLGAGNSACHSQTLEDKRRRQAEAEYHVNRDAEHRRRFKHAGTVVKMTVDVLSWHVVILLPL